MNRIVFLDSAYPVALFSKQDEHYQKAWKLAEELRIIDPQLVTIRAVMIEIGNSLSKIRYRKQASAYLNMLENNKSVEIVPMTEMLYKEAVALYQSRLEKS